MAKAWYTYPRIDNFGAYPDPVGNYAKPDSNIDAPSGTPITALAPGTVTSVRIQPWGPQAWSITVKLDQPLNAVADHMAYNYVSSPVVSQGQHVDFGTQLATAGNPYNIGTAFALCHSDVYGTATIYEPFSGPYISPELNPVPFLDSLTGGSTAPSGSSSPASNPLATIGQTVLNEVGVNGAAIDAINAANSNGLTYIGAGIVGAGALAAGGILFLLMGGL